jgi:hypothetical protein
MSVADCAMVYGPSTTIYSCFRRWAMRSIWRRLFEDLVEVTPDERQFLDSSTAQHRGSCCGMLDELIRA